MGSHISRASNPHPAVAAVAKRPNGFAYAVDRTNIVITLEALAVRRTYGDLVDFIETTTDADLYDLFTG